MDKKTDDIEKTPATEQGAAPARPSEDMQQFSKWMAEYGKPALTGLVLAAVILAGISVWRGRQASKAEAAVQALFQSQSPEEFQQLALRDPQAATAPLALAGLGLLAPPTRPPIA